MNVRLGLVALVTQVAALGVAAPAMASTPARWGEHSGSVLFAESLGDAAKRVGQQRKAAPRAGVDIASAQFTQTDGQLTLTLGLRRLTPATVDRFAVNFDIDGDARPDQGLRWSARNQVPMLVQLDGTFDTVIGTIACADTEVRLDPPADQITVLIDRACLVGGEASHVRSLQAATHDRVNQHNPRGELVRAKWDFLGGRTTMLRITF